MSGARGYCNRHYATYDIDTGCPDCDALAREEKAQQYEQDSFVYMYEESCNADAESSAVRTLPAPVPVKNDADCDDDADTWPGGFYPGMDMVMKKR